MDSGSVFVADDCCVSFLGDIGLTVEGGGGRGGGGGDGRETTWGISIGMNGKNGCAGDILVIFGI